MGAAHQAGRIIMDHYGKLDHTQISAKNRDFRNDFVTEVDARAEACIISYVRRAFPDHAILAEESGKHDMASPYRWIIDPLDGTTNFIHGIPMFAVSIALEVNGVLEVGVVLEPSREELFVAERGRGAFMNDRRISVSQNSQYRRLLLATGFPFKDFKFVDDYLKLFRFFMAHSSGIRRAGSAALDLCYLACGRFDGFWELCLNPWDIAAGALIVEEAGGRITNFQGGPDFLYTGNIVGSNGLIQQWMLDNVREVFGDRLT